MKKIQTKTEIERRNKRNYIIIGIVMVFVLVIGTIGYAFTSKERVETKKEKENYAGLEFIKTESGFWRTSVSGYEFFFQYLPKETSNITIPFVSLNEYNGKPLYFIIVNNEAANEISMNIGRFASRMPQEACLAGRECKNAELPEKNCSSNLIIFEEKNKTEVRREESCIFIESAYDEMTRAADAFVYKLLGIV